MIEIIPAVLEKSFATVAARLRSVAGSTTIVQIDICDGSFVPTLTWPFLSPMAPEKSLNYDPSFQNIVDDKLEMPCWENFEFELDLMVKETKRVLPELMTIGPTRVIFHAETFGDLETELDSVLRLLPTIVEPAVAINADTSPESLWGVLDTGMVMSVQCMGIAKIGGQGEVLDERVFANLRALRARYPKLTLSVDGGVTLENATRLIEAGANRLVVGSAIFTAPDIVTRITEFKNLI